jgi:hypothetical protein
VLQNFHRGLERDALAMSPAKSGFTVDHQLRIIGYQYLRAQS